MTRINAGCELIIVIIKPIIHTVEKRQIVTAKPRYIHLPGKF